MTTNRVRITSKGVLLGEMTMLDAAGTLEQMSGAHRLEVLDDLRGGITFECDGITFTPAQVLGRPADQRVSHYLSPAERASAMHRVECATLTGPIGRDCTCGLFPAGRKA